MAAAKGTVKFRELFIEELAEVHGGAPNPLEALLDKLGCCETTMACCEEGSDGCCNDDSWS